MTVSTRFLILSDTHADRGIHPAAFLPQSQPYDVVIHCGDLTDGSTLEEYEITLDLLSRVDAPLKLIIPGNHDFTLDDGAFEKIRAESVRADATLDMESMDRVYGQIGDARRMLEECKGVTMLVAEGNYEFRLANGARLDVFASPFTPSKNDSNWGFQYHPDEGHNWSAIGDDVDVVITHGPPAGILDRVDGRRAGCPQLFAAIAKTKPRLHCFGHIHQGWGAKQVAWRDGDQQQMDQERTHFTAIDNEKSSVIESLAGITPGKFDDPDDIDAKQRRMAKYRWERAATANGNLGEGLGSASSTLFVNASIEEQDENGSFQLPWIVTLELKEAA